MMMKPICPWVFSWDKQIDMPEDAAARLVEDEIAQGAVLGDEARLLPQGFAWRGRDAASDHIADLALSVAGDDVDNFIGAHSFAASPIEIDGLREFISSGAVARQRQDRRVSGRSRQSRPPQPSPTTEKRGDNR
jgi:hypothetical protein